MLQRDVNFHFSSAHSQASDMFVSCRGLLRAATAAVVADTGIPLDAASARKLAPPQKDESIKKLAEASAALNNDRQGAAELAAGLGRTTIGKEHREQIGPKVASTMGFPASGSRRFVLQPPPPLFRLSFPATDARHGGVIRQARFFSWPFQDDLHFRWLHISRRVWLFCAHSLAKDCCMNFKGGGL